MADNDNDLQRSLNAAAETPAPRAISTPRKLAPKAIPANKPGGLTGPGNVAKSLNPANRTQAIVPPPIKDTFPFDVAMHMGFLGTGQGGSRIAQAFWELGYRRVGAFNTTDSDFEGLDKDMPMLSLDIGGAAKDAGLARQALEGRDVDVWDLLTRSWGNNLDCAIVCASLGGGTGSGTVAKLVQIARKYMLDKGRPERVGAIISLPPVEEGQTQAKNAVMAFKQLLEVKASPIIVIDNARINELYKPGMLKLHATANDTVAQLFHLFNQMAAVRSQLITFDRAEFAQLLDGGIVTMAAAEIPSELSSPADVSTAIREQLAQSVLASCNLAKGKKAACLFIGGEEILDKYPLDYFEAGYTQLDRIVGSAYDREKIQTVIHRGLYLGTEEGLQCYTMISELEPPMERMTQLARKAGLDVKAVTSSMATLLGL